MSAATRAIQVDMVTSFFCTEEQILPFFSFPLLQWVFITESTNFSRLHGSLSAGYYGMETKQQYCVTFIVQLVPVRFFTPEYRRSNTTLTICFSASCDCTINSPVYLYLNTPVFVKIQSKMQFLKTSLHWFLIGPHYLTSYLDLSDWEAHHTFITQLTLRGIHDPSHV